MQWLVSVEVLPRLVELDAHGNYVASPLITRLPSIANGGVTLKPFAVTYHLNPAARWEPDGTPITAADVLFSWNASNDTAGSVFTFRGVDRIETPDLHTVRIVFKRAYPDWPDLLGGFAGVILEKARFTSTDVSKTMTDAIGFSGGPWMLRSFTPQREVLVANTRYWDAARVPKIPEVDVVPTGSNANALRMLRTGDVSVLYPQPDADLIRGVQTLADVQRTFGTTTQSENLWFNEKPGHPFADLDVRAAFSYAFDRQHFLDALVKPFDPGVQLLNCAVWTPGIGPWCNNQDFADVRPDPTKVAALMAAAGFTKDARHFWAKDGHELVIAWMANTDNARRLEAQRLFIPQLAHQGFRVIADNTDAATMFQKRIPAGDYDVAMYISEGGGDPSVGGFLTSFTIPGPANDNQGENTTWFSDPTVDRLSEAADAELDVARRAVLVHQIGARLRADYVTLPLYVFPTFVAWRSDLVTGPVDQDIDNPESVFANMYAWTTREH